MGNLVSFARQGFAYEHRHPLSLRERYSPAILYSPESEEYHTEAGLQGRSAVARSRERGAWSKSRSPLRLTPSSPLPALCQYRPFGSRHLLASWTNGTISGRIEEE